MKRIRLVFLLTLIAVFSWIVIGYAKTYVLAKVTKNTMAKGEAMASLSRAQPQSIVIGAYVAPGFPIRFTEAVAVNDKGASTLSYTLANTDANAVNGLNLALFDFNPAGRLMKIQSWRLQADLKSGASEKFSLALKHRVTPGDRLILSVDSIRGGAGGWKTNFGELAVAASILVVGGQGPPPSVSRTDASLPDSYGADYCSEAFGKAFRLSKVGDAKRLTSFSCDRDRRSFAFCFGAKSLNRS
jgi:hypothetical protein